MSDWPDKDPLDEHQPSTRVRKKFLELTPTPPPSGSESSLAALQELEEERDRFKEMAQRARADLENYRRRVRREQEVEKEKLLASLLSELSSGLNTLRLAAKADEGSTQLVYQQLEASLLRMGVRIDEPVGESFEPARHEALMTRAVEGEPSGKVLEVLSPGYQVGELMVQPARVVVSE